MRFSSLWRRPLAGTVLTLLVLLPRAGAQSAVPKADELATDEPAVVVNDPLEGFNRAIFHFNDRLYTYAFIPLVRGYEAVVPAPVRRGLANASENMRFPVRFVSSLLEGKPRLAAKELGKFVVNTTAGIGGLSRVSDQIPALAHLHPSGMAETLGAWGLPSGAYLVLPVLGSSSVRDVFGTAGDLALTPTYWDTLHLGQRVWIAKPYRWPVDIVDFVDQLPGGMHTYVEMKEAALDPYVASRNAYLDYRRTLLKP